MTVSLDTGSWRLADIATFFAVVAVFQQICTNLTTNCIARSGTQTFPTTTECTWWTAMTTTTAVIRIIVNAYTRTATMDVAIGAGGWCWCWASEEKAGATSTGVDGIDDPITSDKTSCHCYQAHEKSSASSVLGRCL